MSERERERNRGREREKVGNDREEKSNNNIIENQNWHIPEETVDYSNCLGHIHSC